MTHHFAILDVHFKTEVKRCKILLRAFRLIDALCASSNVLIEFQSCLKSQNCERFTKVKSQVMQEFSTWTFTLTDFNQCNVACFENVNKLFFHAKIVRKIHTKRSWKLLKTSVLEHYGINFGWVVLFFVAFLAILLLGDGSPASCLRPPHTSQEYQRICSMRQVQNKKLQFWEWRN